MISINCKLKLVAIICFIFISISGFIAYANPAKGYELSIYDSTPLITWILIFASITGGLIIIVHQIYTQEYKKSHFWRIGFLILVLYRVLLLYLPHIRGYITWRGDILSHIGLLNEIIFRGHFTNENFYPVIHTLPAEIISVTGMSSFTGWIFVNSALCIIYIFSIYLLARIILPKREQQLLTVALVTTADPIIGWPSMSVFLFPLLFFFYYKRLSPTFRIVFTMFLILYPFTHVLSSSMAIIVMLIIESSKKAFSIINHKTGIIPVQYPTFSLTPIIIELVILLPWMLSFYSFHNNLRLLWSQIQTGAGPDVLGGIGSQLDKIDIHGFEFVRLLFMTYGIKIIFIIFSFIATYIVIKQIRSGSIKNETQALFSLLNVFLFTAFLYFLYLLGAPGLAAIEAGRIMSFMMVFTPIFVGFSLYELSSNTHFKHLMIGGIICMILLTSFFSIFSLYSSPYTMNPNNQVTQMDLAGMAWYIGEKNITVKSVNIMTPPGRFAMEILGILEARKRADLDYGRYTGIKIPDHFDYIKNSSLGESYCENKYAVITKYDRVLYTTVWKSVGRFNDSDFEKFEHDSTVSKLYSNSELDVYFIHPVRNLNTLSTVPYSL